MFKIVSITVFVIAVPFVYGAHKFYELPAPYIAQSSEDVAYLKSKIDFNDVKLPGTNQLLSPTSFLQSRINSPIINGRPASPCSFGFMVAIYFAVGNETFFCGGTLISENYVLTAAHCTDGAEYFVIIFGATDLSQNESTQIGYFVNGSAATINPEWNSEAIRNDIAVIELPQPVPLSDCIYLSQLPSRSQASSSFAGYTGTQVGWGKTSDISSTSNVLKYNKATIILNFVCSIYFGNTVTSGNICTSGFFRMSTCSGDSGGPLLIQSHSNKIQVGITSFGFAASCLAGYPSAFTRITSYLDFIESNTDVTIN